MLTKWQSRFNRPITFADLAQQWAPGQKCRVWTASYGGQKALIIRSVIDKVVNYTVLDVNDGAEKREAAPWTGHQWAGIWSASILTHSQYVPCIPSA